MRKPLSLVYSLFPTTKSLTFFLISVKMDLASKVLGFQFVQERGISNHERFYQDSNDEGNTTKQDVCQEKFQL